MKEFICIQCPRGCHLSIDENTLEVTGNSCPRGASYAKNELTNPLRTITTTVKVEDGDIPYCSVRTKEPVPKKIMFDVIKELSKITLKAPVKVNDVVLANVLDTGVDVIATKNIDKVK